jgi:DNA-binding winged helix-turn-helix (wHTH) protein/Flp pilus assembly protein TadD
LFLKAAMGSPVRHLLEFGPFRIDPERRLLLRDEKPISLSSKSFDLLLVLTQREGQVVPKDDLMKALWPDSFVEESNLGQHVFQLRKALGERPQDHTYIITVPGRGYRFAQSVRSVPVEGANNNDEEQIVVASRSLARIVIEGERKRDLRLWASVATALVAILFALGVYWRSQRRPKLTERDTIVLADFDNRTGDPVFDETLRLSLSAQLEQSPFLNLLSDQRARQTLALMAQSKDARLTQENAREVCQRTASTAVLNGSIAKIGARYLITLKAINCANGESLASTTAAADDKNQVLDALGKTASDIRGKLGESLASVQKYDVPPENVTTASLDALRAYGLAHQTESSNQGADAVSLYQRAVSLDPNFAQAYLGLGIDYFNHDETSRAAENIRKAYELRERVSEREKLGIETFYNAVVVGNFEAARQSQVLATQIYPRDARAFSNLGVFYSYLGDYEKSLAASQQALKLNPGAARNYSNLLIDYLHNNRLEEATSIAEEAKSHQLDSPFIHANLYLVDFIRHDVAGMEREEVQGKSGSEDLILYYESDTAANEGHFVQARELTKRAADIALRAGQKETMAGYEAEAAVREALVGNLALAKRQAKYALTLSNGRDAVAMSGVALGIAGDNADSKRTGDDLNKRFPEDTVVQDNLLPAIRAASALRNGDPGKAIAALASVPYELGQTAQEVNFVLYPVYLRGQAYLATKQAAAAATEFQKILDHPGLVENEPIGALAHLGLGRAYIVSRNAAKARIEYQNFFSLWKDADRDIPILKEAKTEYTTLR